MKPALGLQLCLALGAILGLSQTFAETAPIDITVHQQPLHEGRIDPMLFGNFVELLDDVVPGMWAELLNDRSFEGVIPSANWCYYDGSLDICDRQWNTNFTWAVDSQNPFNGSRSAKLSPTEQPATLSQSELAVKRGMNYAFSGYLKADGKLKVTVLLRCLLPTGDWLTLASRDLPSVSAQWQKYTATLTSKGQTDHAVFELRAKGRGHLWADKLSLMPANNLEGWRPDVVEAIREVRPAIIRWGGSSVDPGHYRWKEGIGDRDSRVPWRNENWGRIDSNDVGIDEFCQFCSLTRSEPLVCVSFADGPLNAGDLVEYCNGTQATSWGAKRVANGRPEPYGVKYWQIGNEIGGNDPAYLAGISEFIRSMKHSDPNIQIMSSFPHQQLLDRVGKELDFVCPHHYTPDLNACDRELTALSRLIDSTPGCAQIKIGVTEWNIDAGSWGLGRAKQATLEAALMNARYLHVLMRHSDKARIACRSNLANSYCGAIIETGASGTGVLRRASYYVMKLYSTHAKPVPLRVEPKTDTLDLFACAAEDRKSGTLFAVNQSRESLPVSVRFDGFRPNSLQAQTVCDALNAGQPDVMNHWQTPERISIMTLPVSDSHITLPPFSATALEWSAN